MAPISGKFSQFMMNIHQFILREKEACDECQIKQQDEIRKQIVDELHKAIDFVEKDCTSLSSNDSLSAKSIDIPL